MRVARVRVVVVAGFAALLAFNGAATLYAAVSTPTIAACVKSSGPDKGLMRYVGGGSCASGETRLSWSVGSGGAAPAKYWVTSTKMVGGLMTDAAPVTLPAGSYRLGLTAWTFGAHGGDTELAMECSYFFDGVDKSGPNLTYSQRYDSLLSDERFVTFTAATKVTAKCPIRDVARLTIVGSAFAQVSATPASLQ
jgi:hypothetical protein